MFNKQQLHRFAMRLCRYVRGTGGHLQRVTSSPELPQLADTGLLLLCSVSPAPSPVPIPTV